MKRLILLSTLLLFILVLALPTSANAAVWIDEDYTRKMALQIDNTGCTTFHDTFPVYINLTYDESMEANFGDLRVGNDSAETWVAYDIINTSDGSWCEIRFNATDVPASAHLNDTYYLYYNNSGASTTQNGSTPYPFGDDFIDKNINDWTIAGGTNVVNASLELITSGDTARHITNFSSGTIEYSFQSRLLHNYFYCFSVNDSWYYRVVALNNGDFKLYVVGDAIYSGSWANDNEWHNVSFGFNNVNGCMTLALDGTTLYGDTRPDIVGKTTAWVQMNTAGTSDQYYDNIRYIPYADPEPILTVGNEEIFGVRDTSIPPVPQNIQNDTGIWFINYTWDAGLDGFYWQNDSVIASGLEDLVTGSTPTVFEMNGTYYMISGARGFIGHNWTGTTWQNDSAIVNGLEYNASFSTCEVFEINDTWYMVWHYLNALAPDIWVGHNWTGTTWQEDIGIASGLYAFDVGIGETGGGPYTPTVFEMNGTTYMVVAGRTGPLGSANFTGYNWTGTTWQNDSAIVNGLPIEAGYYYLKPEVECINDIWYMILGEFYGTFYGYNWNGTGWESNAIIDNGLIDVGSCSAPAVFEMDDTYYLISGETVGTFVGYNWTSNITDSYNVSITNSSGEYWINGSDQTWYNTTNITLGEWVNISVWAYNTSNHNLSNASATQNTYISCLFGTPQPADGETGIATESATFSMLIYSTDDVNVSFINNDTGETFGTDSDVSNGSTASISADLEGLTTYEWYIEIELSDGSTITSPVYTFYSTSTITFFEENNPSVQITINVSITGTNGTGIWNTTAVDGNFNLSTLIGTSQLILGEEIALSISADGFYERHLVIPEGLGNIWRIYLLNESTTAITSTFTILDYTGGDFSTSDTIIIVERILSGEERYICGGYRGVGNSVGSILQLGGLYTVSVTNDEETRILGSHYATTSSEVELIVGLVEYPVEIDPDNQGIAWNVTRGVEHYDNGTIEDAWILVLFNDTESVTTWVNFTIYDAENSSIVFYSTNVTTNASLITVTYRPPIAEIENGTAFLVNMSTSLNPTSYTLTRLDARDISVLITPISLFEDYPEYGWVAGCFILVFVALLFSHAFSDVGGFVVGGVGLCLWIFGIFPQNAMSTATVILVFIIASLNAFVVKSEKETL